MAVVGEANSRFALAQLVSMLKEEELAVEGIGLPWIRAQ